MTRARTQDGFMMIAAIILVTVVMGLGLGMLMFTDTQQHNSEHDNSKYDTVDYARQHDSWKQHAVNHKSDWNNHAGSVADERALCTSSRVDLQHRNNFQLDYPGQHPRQHDWQ